MSMQEELLQDLEVELSELAKDAIKWTYRRARDKADTLEMIWDTIPNIRIGSPLYHKTEKLRLEVLRQISRVDAKRFRLLRKEFREGTISAHAEISLVMIRLRSKSDRVFEWIHKEWFHQEEGQSGAK